MTWRGSPFLSSAEVRQWYSTIGARGNESIRGTEAAKLRSQRAQEVRPAKEAAFKALGPVAASPQWVAAVHDFLHETTFKRTQEKRQFQMRVSKCVEANDMRKLGKFFELVEKYLRKKDS